MFQGMCSIFLSINIGSILQIVVSKRQQNCTQYTLINFMIFTKITILQYLFSLFDLLGKYILQMSVDVKQNIIIAYIIFENP